MKASCIQYIKYVSGLKWWSSLFLSRQCSSTSKDDNTNPPDWALQAEWIYSLGHTVELFLVLRFGFFVIRLLFPSPSSQPMGSGWKSPRCERKQACNGPGFNVAERTQIAYSAEFQVCRELFTHYLLFGPSPPVWFGLGVFIVIYSVTGCKYVGKKCSLR